MHGLGEFAVDQWGTFFVAAFVIELVLNRYPWIVSVSVPAVWFAVLTLRDRYELNSDFVAIYGTIALIGFLPSLIGAGLARLIRFWIELKRAERSDPDVVEE